MAEGQQQQPPQPPLVIKRVKKGGHGAHHGGSWKIAYADFVTAMMAFFLLLWLLNSVTQESLEGIANYFAPIAASTSTSGSGEILGGKVLSEEGVGESQSAAATVTMDLPPPRAGSGGEDQRTTPEEGGEESLDDAMKRLEQEQFEEAQEALKKAVEGIPEFEALKDSLMIDSTPEGLRIQIVDQDGLAMFPSGSAQMYDHTRKLLGLVSKVILAMPQQVSISGHTDATRFSNDRGYSNWELSSERANAARRALMSFGVPYDRVSRVVGKAATEPLLPDDPKHARNRRLSIILLRGTGFDDMKKDGLPEEELPGLREIKRKQLENLQKSLGGQSSNIQLQPTDGGSN